MKEDYKVVLVNTKDPEGMKIMNSSSKVIKEVPSDYFKFQNSGQHDYCRTEISGQLADDPAFYFRKRDTNSRKKGDKFTDPSVFVNLNVIATTEMYQDKRTGELRQISSNVSARSFLEYDKRALSLLHKGDRISITGDLRTYQSKNRMKTWFYIKIKTFTVNPYKTISNMASEAFDAQEPARRTNDILSDYRISNDEKKAQLIYTNLQKDKKLAEQQKELEELRKQVALNHQKAINKTEESSDPASELEVNMERAEGKYDNEEDYYNTSAQNSEPQPPYDKIVPVDDNEIENKKSLDESIPPEDNEKIRESDLSDDISVVNTPKSKNEDKNESMNTSQFNTASSSISLDSISRSQITDALNF
ncbi:hypothetical protein [Lactobacillus crispatus]|uniref:hypothetical protein n=1 Tax=Lactobacillus crispatus TaxID=47770 RepID=UPI00105C2D9E|nr:hypothetical protein [Lactobacillus crispatus]TDN00580.1 hypothetical protein CEE85_13835 [Lactobacillus crispatus]